MKKINRENSNDSRKSESHVDVVTYDYISFILTWSHQFSHNMNIGILRFLFSSLKIARFGTVFQIQIAW